MEAPVVVNPEDASKNASIKEGIVPLTINGKVPAHESISHESDTARNPSLLVTFSEEAFLEKTKRTAANAIVINDEKMNGNVDSSYIRAVGRQKRNEKASMKRIVLKI